MSQPRGRVNVFPSLRAFRRSCAETLFDAIRKRGESRGDRPAKWPECTEVVSILTIDRLAFITNRTDTSVERSSASVGAQFHRFSISARQHCSTRDGGAIWCSRLSQHLI